MTIEEQLIDQADRLTAQSERLDELEAELRDLIDRVEHRLESQIKSVGDDVYRLERDVERARR